MAEQMKPRNIFEQIALGLNTVNDNIVDLYRMVDEIHGVLFPPENPEPNVSGTGENEVIGNNKL